MSKDLYKFDGYRCLSVWIIHSSSFIFFFLVSISLVSEISDSNYLNLVYWFLFLLLLYVPHTLLFLNHLKYEKETIILLENTQITVIKQEVKKVFHIEDVVKVQEYEATKTPWTIIVKWKISTPIDEVTISSITFPRTEMWRLFGKKLERSVNFFPSFPNAANAALENKG